MNTEHLWKSILAEIELSVSRATFSTWFKDTYIIGNDEAVWTVGAPNEFVRQWLEEKYQKTILRCLREKIEGIRSIEFIVSNRASKKQKITDESTKEKTNINELPLQEHYIDKQDNLNPRYTFGNFIIGSFNELAHAASQAVVDKPGSGYNPLFIYGDTGHGKTHLIQAVGNALKQRNPKKRLLYVTSEQFTVDFISAVQANKAQFFKERYRAYDVFIMDDIQFLSKKDKTQEELFHLFNTFHENNKQIIFSSDKHPAYLPDIEARLISRFSAGMVVEIPPPDHESRTAIIKVKAKLLGVNISDDVIEYLAEVIPGNIREIEGALNTVLFNIQMRGDSAANLMDVKNLIRERIKPKRVIPIETIVRTVSDFYGLDESNIYQKIRRKEVVKPRQMIMYILREDFNISYPTIGQTLGGRDHTTVIHSCDKIKEDIKNDHGIAKELQQIRALLG
jgi:chromosomal replication initiator protein